MYICTYVYIVTKGVALSDCVTFLRIVKAFTLEQQTICIYLMPQLGISTCTQGFF